MLPLVKASLNPEHHHPHLPGPSWTPWAEQVTLIIRCCLLRALQVSSMALEFYIHSLFKSCKQFHPVSALLSPILQMRKLRLRELAQGRIAGKWQRGDSK